MTSQQAQAGRIGAAILHSRYDSHEITSRAREVYLASFLTAVDPDNTLPEPERIRRALSLRKAHFLRLAMLSAKARRARKQKNGGGDDGS